MRRNNLIAKVSLCVLVSVTLSGCLAVSRVAVSSLCGQDSYNEKYIKGLEKKRGEMQATYRGNLSRFKRDHESSKKKINAAIKSRQLGVAIDQLKILHKQMNPCKVSKCGQVRPKYSKKTYPNGPQKKENLIVKEDLRDNEFIEDAVKRTAGLLPVMMKRKEFMALDKGLTNLKGFPADAKTMKRFLNVKKNTKKLWMEQLIAEVGSAKQKTPGAALAYALKAYALAAEIQDGSQKAKLGREVKALRALLMDRHGLVFAVGRTAGSQSGRVLESVKRKQWKQKIRYSRSNSRRVDAVVSFSLGEPSHSRSTSSTTGSFQYKSGTKQVRNPALGRLESDLARAKKALASDQEACQNFRKRKASGQTSSSSSSNCNDIPNEQKRVQKAQSALRSTPKTITKDVFSSQSYPITVHHLKSRMSFQGSAVSSRGLRTISDNRGVSAHLKDEAHGQHRKNGSGVGADPANPPSTSRGVASLNGSAIGKVNGLIQGVFSVKRQGYLRAKTTSENQRLHNLMVYLLLDTTKLDPKIVKQIESVSKTNQMAPLLKIL